MLWRWRGVPQVSPQPWVSSLENLTSALTCSLPMPMTYKVLLPHPPILHPQVSFPPLNILYIPVMKPILCGLLCLRAPCPEGQSTLCCLYEPCTCSWLSNAPQCEGHTACVSTACLWLLGSIHSWLSFLMTSCMVMFPTSHAPCFSCYVQPQGLCTDCSVFPQTPTPATHPKCLLTSPS